MKGFINACGERDSLGNLRNLRGLVEFGGKPLIFYTLDKFKEIGIEEVLIYTNRNQKDIYQQKLISIKIFLLLFFLLK